MAEGTGSVLSLPCVYPKGFGLLLPDGEVPRGLSQSGGLIGSLRPLGLPGALARVGLDPLLVPRRPWGCR